MYPTLAQLNLPFIGLVNIYSFGFMLLMGIVFCIVLFVKRGLDIGYNMEFLIDLSFYVMLCGLLGARIMYVIYFNDQFNWAIFKIWEDKGFNVGFAVFWIIVFWMMFTNTFLGGQLRSNPLRLFVILFFILRRKYKEIAKVTYSIVLFITLGRIGHILENYEYYDFDILAIWKGGIIFYGGLFGGILGGVIVLLLKKMNILKIADIAFPLIFLGLFFGRIGCFLRGCCWGKICHSNFLCVIFPKDSLAYFDHVENKLIESGIGSSLPVYPVQLFEGFICLFLFIFFWQRFKNRKFDGQMSYEVLLLYSVERFFMEFFRGDMTKFGNIFSFAQLISLPITLLLMIVGVTVLYKFYTKKAESNI